MAERHAREGSVARDVLDQWELTPEAVEEVRRELSSGAGKMEE